MDTQDGSDRESTVLAGGRAEGRNVLRTVGRKKRAKLVKRQEHMGKAGVGSDSPSGGEASRLVSCFSVLQSFALREPSAQHFNE